MNLRIRFIENEENLCQQRLELLSNVRLASSVSSARLRFSLQLDEAERLKQPLISAKEMIKVRHSNP